MPDFVPFHRPSIDDSDVEAVAAVLRSGWLTHGPRAQEFERAVAKLVGTRRGVSVSSGTSAMHLALVALGIGAGDEVITTPFTFCSTAHVIEHVGAKPVFADIESAHLQIDPVEIKAAMTARTRAILPVDYGGHPCAIEEILGLAHSAGIPVVEDAAHALGASTHGRPIGSLATITAFSFYVTKTITTGEGGMATTDDEPLADHLEVLRLHGISRDAWSRYRRGGSWYYEVVELGFKANLTDLQAALGLSQLAREGEMRRRRALIAQRYDEAFAPYPELFTCPSVAPGVSPAWHLYPLRLNLETLALSRDDFITQLEGRGVGTSVHFIPLHLQPHFQKKYGFAPGDFPNSEDAYRRLVSLPLYPSLSNEELEHVVVSVIESAHDPG